MNESALSRVISGTISVGVGNVAAMVLGFLSTIVAARYLPAKVFGIFVLLHVVASFLERVSSLGLNLSVAKFIASTDENEYRRRMINSVFWFRGFVSLVVAVLAFLAGPVLGNLFSSPAVFKFVVFVIALYFLLSILQLLKAILQGFFLFRAIAFTAVIGSFFNFILILIFVLYFKEGLAGLVYAKVISTGLACCFAYFCIPVQRKLECHTKVLKQILVFGLPLQINDILTFIFLRIDTLLIASLLGPASIAYYEIGRKIPESFAGLYEAFRYAYFPLVSRLQSRKELGQLTQLIKNSVRLISFASILGAVIALVFGKNIIVLFFSEQYLPSVTIFVLLMVGLNLAVVEYTFGYSLVAIGDSDKPLIVNIVRTCTCLAGNLILIPIFGAVGAALANIAGNSMTSPIDVFFLRRRKIDVRIADYLKPIIIFGVISGLYVVLERNLVLIKLAIIILYLILCKLFCVISYKDLISLAVEIKAILHKLFGKSPLEVPE